MSSITIKKMFDLLAPRYDLFNKLVSFSLDRYWRMRALKWIYKERSVLDICTGTGGIAIAVKQKVRGSVIGIDFSQKMISIAKHRKHAGVKFLLSEAEEIPFPDNMFDYVTSSFAMRNVVNETNKVLNEMYRVTKSFGRIILLEFGNPESVFLRRIYHFYLKKVLPLIGMLLYRKRTPFLYLANSIISWDSQKFIEKIEKAGFKEVQYFALTGGIAGVYTGIK